MPYTGAGHAFCLRLLRLHLGQRIAEGQRGHKLQRNRSCNDGHDQNGVAAFQHKAHHKGGEGIGTRAKATLRAVLPVAVGPVITITLLSI